MENKIRDVDKKYLTLVIYCFEYKIGEVENKTPDRSGLVTTAVLNTKIGEVENKIPDVGDLVKKNQKKNRL